MNEDDAGQSYVLPLRPMLSFADASHEQRFVLHYNTFYYRYAQISLAVGLVLILCDFLADFLVASDEPANFYRIQLCLPLLGVGIACSFTPYARRHWQPIMAGFIVVVAFSLFGVLLLLTARAEWGCGRGLAYSILSSSNFIALSFSASDSTMRLFPACCLCSRLKRQCCSILGSAGESLYLSYQVLTSFILAAGIGWWREFVLRKDFSIQTTLKTAKDALKDQNTLPESEVEKRAHELLASQDAAILTLAAIVETRDLETGNHVRRTQHYVKALAKQLQSHPRFADYLTDDQIDILFKSAPLHDIGKVGFPTTFC